MKLQWEQHRAGHAASARTPFVKMHARQSYHASTPKNVVYEAAIATLNLDALREAPDTFPTLETAQAWCEAEYARLLRDELARLETAESAKAIEANGARLLATVVRDLGGELLFDTDLESRPVRIEQRGDGWSAVLGDA